MLINDRYNVYKLAQVTGMKFLALLAASAAVSFVAAALDAERFMFPTPLVGMFVAAVSIFLAFRINVGYSRWWLARQVWGGLVNESRSLGVYVATMLRSGGAPTQAERERHRRIVYRHIGFISALRLQLRHQGPADWEREIWGRRINGRPLFSDDETAKLKASANVATQVVVLQGEDIADYFGHSGDRRQVRMSQLLREFYIRQGQSEAIKNTVLAWGYVYYTKILDADSRRDGHAQPAERPLHRRHGAGRLHCDDLPHHRAGRPQPRQSVRGRLQRHAALQPLPLDRDRHAAADRRTVRPRASRARTRTPRLGVEPR